jgi:hypothetical protein
LITHWREEVWQNALQMIETANPGEREQKRQQIEVNALERGKAILFRDASGGISSLI